MVVYGSIRRAALALFLVLANSCSEPEAIVGNDPSPMPTDAGLNPSAYGIRRLTLSQIQNTLHDLLGASVVVPTDLEADTYNDDFATTGMAQLSISIHAAEQFQDAAYNVAQQALSSGPGRAAFVGCTPTGVTDDGCATTFVGTIGLRAWRRPLTDTEVNRYVQIAHSAATALSDFYGGLQYALAGLLLSPNFLYLVQTGEVDPTSPSRLRYTGYEMASRLSFFFWNTAPDEALLAAASRSELTTAGGVRAQAQRLLDDPRGRAVITNFFSALFGFRWLPDLERDPQLFPQFQSPTFPNTLLQQTLLDINDRVFVSNGDYRGFFDSTTTFVNAELARFYGLPPVAASGFIQAQLPADGPRAGLLGYAAFQALYTHDTVTSPTLRGFVVRRSLLCETIPLPEANVPPNIPPNDSTTPMTLRQMLTAHEQNPDCASCHSQMDPLGFGLENFDPGGGYRTLDDGLPIDPSGTLDGVAFAGLRDLATALHDHPAVPGCFVRRVFRYSTGQFEATADQDNLNALVQDFASGGYRAHNFLIDFASSDAFRYATTAP